MMGRNVRAAVAAAVFGLGISAGAWARAQDAGMFARDIRWPAAPMTCATACDIGSQAIAHADFFIRAVPWRESARLGAAQAYAARGALLLRQLLESGKTEADVQAGYDKLHDLIVPYFTAAHDSYGALTIDSFSSLLARCDAANGYDTPPMVLRERDTGVPANFFDPRIYRTKAGCAAGYAFLAEISVPANPMIASFLEGYPTLDLTGLRTDQRAAALVEPVGAGGGEPSYGEEVDGLIGRMHVRIVELQLAGSMAWQLAALMDGLTACDRRYDFHPRTRSALLQKDDDALGNATCISALRVGRDRIGGDAPYDALTDGYFAEAVTPGDMDRRDLLDDRAFMVVERWNKALDAGTWKVDRELRPAVEACLSH